MKVTREMLQEEAEKQGRTLDYLPKLLIANIFDMGEEEWKKSMNQGIGSSSAGTCLGKNPSKSTTEMIIEKVYGKSKPIKDDPDTNYRLNSGHMQEVPLLKWYAEQIGYVVALTDPENPSTSDIKDVTEITLEEWDKWEGKGVVCVDHARYCHPDYPYIYSDMDGVCYPPDRRDMYVLECKTADSSDFKWKWHSGVWGEGNTSVGNAGYIDQARQHMLVANTLRCDIISTCSFNALDNVIVTVYRNMSEEKKIIDTETEVWNKIQNGEIPAFTKLSDRALENITYIISPDTSDDEVGTIPISKKDDIKEIFILEDEIKALETEVKEKEERINAIKLGLIPILGEHRIAKMEGFKDGYEIKVELNQTLRTSLDTKRLKIEAPDIASLFMKTTVGDPKLTVKETKIKKVKEA